MSRRLLRTPGMGWGAGGGGGTPTRPLSSPAGDRYVVADCGGGTVDLTVHQIEKPQGTLKELYKASGGLRPPRRTLTPPLPRRGPLPVPCRLAAGPVAPPAVSEEQGRGGGGPWDGRDGLGGQSGMGG